MKTLILFCMLLLSSMSVFGGQVTLAWDASVSEDVTNYKIYYGNASGVYDVSQDVGNVLMYTLDNLADGTYYIAATALNAAGNESVYSNEVSVTISTPEPPVLSECRKEDLNCDGEVNVLDLQLLINTISEEN